jgi:hypothetical protein
MGSQKLNKMNKKTIFVIFLVSLGLTTLGLLIDSDPKNNSIWNTMFEYIAMLILTFTAIVILYEISNFVFTQIKQKTV